MGEPPTSRPLPRLILAAAVLAVVIVAVLLMSRRPASDSERAAHGTSDTPPPPAPPSSHSPREPAAASSNLTDTGAPRAKRFSADDRRRRDEMRELIYRAFNRKPPEKVARSAGAPLQPLGADAPVLDKDYIRHRIRGDFVPMAKECYEAALEREGGLGGKLVFAFTIVGDESVGGIVESVDFAEGSDIDDDELLLCMRESLLAMTFAPPEKGGIVTVTYPFKFSPEDPPDAGSAN